MNVAMLTAYDQKAEEYARFGIPNKQAYCSKHGIDFICEKTFPPDGPLWGKLLLIVKNLPKYDWIFWTDADSLIMNSEVVFTPYTTKDLIISFDRGTLNAGQMWIRNCAWAYDFFIRCYMYRHGAWFADDNGAIMQLFEDCPNDAAHFEVVSQRLFNSYAHNGSYKPGDFIIHFAGQGDKVNLMKKWLDRAK